MITDDRLNELTRKAAEITGVDVPDISAEYDHTPDKNSIRWVRSYKIIRLTVSDWVAEMDEDTMTMMLVYFFDRVFNDYDADMPDEVKAWVDANRHKWTEVEA
jgi:hypothetical protein